MKRLFVDSEFRSLQAMHRAAELVRNGRLGKLHTVRTGSPKETFPEEAKTVTAPPPELDYDLWLGPAPKVDYMQKRVHTPHDLRSRPGWMRNRDYCDGMITNWGTHLNDIGQWGAGTERTGPACATSPASAQPMRVAIYPHVGCWVHRVEDALRVVKKVDRKNVGLTFNLCHALMDGAEDRIPALLEETAPYLFVVTINGTDSHLPKPTWAQLIQPLDKGSYDAGIVLRKLKDSGLQRSGRPAMFQHSRRPPEAVARLNGRLAQADRPGAVM